MSTMRGPIYHALFRCFSLSGNYARSTGIELPTVKRYARHFELPFVLMKTDGRPGLIYAESSDAAALKDWARKMAAVRGGCYRCVVPPSKAPVPEDRPVKAYGERMIEVGTYKEFGEQLARRGLIDWWLWNKAFRDTKDAGSF